MPSVQETLPIKAQKKEKQTQPNALPKLARLPELVLLPAGSFDMGEQNQEFIKALIYTDKKFFGDPGKHIQIGLPFYLGKTEVTYEQYDYYIREQQQNGIQVESPNTAKGGRGNQPVVNITWHQAKAYTEWLGDRTGQACRLPTEAEWEYAARAGKQTAYPWGEEHGNNNANCDGCGSQWDNKQSASVGSFAANGFGLYDMSGNVWEWTCSAWRDQFDGQEQHCTDQENTEARVLRGGSWSSHPDFARSATRLKFHPDFRHDGFGFRVLCSFPIDE